MALKTAFGRANIPQDVVQLTEKEALEFQKRLVLKWPSQSEVLFLKYGHVMAGATTFYSTVVITNYFRRFFNIKIAPKLIPFVPSLFMPTFLSAEFSKMILTNNTLLMRLNCPICKQLKGSLCQVAFGIVSPSILAFATACTWAHLKRLTTFPSLSTNPVGFWKETFELLKRGKKQFQILGLIHVFTISFLTYMQNKEFVHISNTLQNNEELIRKLKLFNEF